jgi:hypothetical protein
MEDINEFKEGNLFNKISPNFFYRTASNKIVATNIYSRTGGHRVTK